MRDDFRPENWSVSTFIPTADDGDPPMETIRKESTNERKKETIISSSSNNRFTRTEIKSRLLRYEGEDAGISEPGIYPGNVPVSAGSYSSLDDGNLLEMLPLGVEPDDRSSTVSLARPKAVKIITYLRITDKIHDHVAGMEWLANTNDRASEKLWQGPPSFEVQF